MPKRKKARFADLTPSDVRRYTADPDAASRMGGRLAADDQEAFDLALAEVGTARKAARDHFQAVQGRLRRAPGAVAGYVSRVVRNGHLEEHDKWEFVLTAAMGWRYIASAGGAFDGSGAFTDRRGRAARLLVDAKHKRSAGLSLKFKDRRRQFERWAREGKDTVPCQVVFFKGGRRGRGVYIVPGIPLKTHVSLKGAAAGQWDPRQPTRPIFVTPLQEMADLSDPEILGRFQEAMAKAVSSIDAKKLSRKVEQDRRTFIANDTKKLMRSREDRSLITGAVAEVVAEDEQAEKELFAQIAARNPQLAKKLRKGGLID